MLCPTCNNVQLVMSERKGIEIDYCPQCRGVWLDRGELDKIIERSAAEQVTSVAQPAPGPVAADQGWGHGAEHRSKPYRKKKHLERNFRLNKQAMSKTDRYSMLSRRTARLPLPCLSIAIEGQGRLWE